MMLYVKLLKFLIISMSLETEVNKWNFVNKVHVFHVLLQLRGQ